MARGNLGHLHFMQRIKSAAVRLAGIIFPGSGHTAILKEMILEKAVYPDGTEQYGFVDEAGEFLTRLEAGEIAEKSGQLIQPLGVSRELFSENVNLLAPYGAIDTPCNLDMPRDKVLCHQD